METAEASSELETHWVVAEGGGDLVGEDLLTEGTTANAASRSGPLSIAG